MATTTLTILDTPTGVHIRADGLPAFDQPHTDAQQVARSLANFAGTQFVGGRPVLLGGALDPVQLRSAS